MTLEHNLARVYAEGFYAVYLEPNAHDRETLIAYLISIFENAFAAGLTRRQRELAQELLSTIGNRTSVPASELRQLVSSLKTVDPVK
jgi:hypothetical protein